MQAGCLCAGFVSAQRSLSRLDWGWLVGSREPYEDFEFLDVLHVHNDEDYDYRLILWLGVMGTAGDGEDMARVVKLIDPEVVNPDDAVQIGWMPASQPYWHRASHCPLRKEE